MSLKCRDEHCGYNVNGECRGDNRPEECRKIPYSKAIWDGYMDQKESCEICSQKLDKRKDEIVSFIYYEKGDIKEELFFCSPMHLIFWCVQNDLIPSDIELITKPIIKKAEKIVRQKE